MKNWVKKLFSSQNDVSGPTHTPPQIELGYLLSSDAVDDVKEKAKGDAFLHNGEFAAAAECYRKAIEANPRLAKAYSNLGFALKEQGLAKDAEHSLVRALEIDPAIADAHYLLGTLCRSDDRIDEAGEYFQEALSLAPDLEFASLDLGRLLFECGKLDDAKQILTNGISHNPTSANLHFYLGNIYFEQNAFDLATTCFRETLLIQPDHAGAFGNLGIIMLKTDDLDAAIDALQKALQINPGYLDASNNLGNAFLKRNDFREAMSSYERGLEIDPHSERLLYNRGLLSLLLGDFESGWKDYEFRWTQLKEGPRHHFSQPLWLNDVAISGKTILLHAEQGIGDALQFIRYVEQVVALGAKVYLEVHPPLKSLVHQLAGIAGVVAMGDALPDFDFHCPFASLPLAFRTDFNSIPSKCPYLRASPERVEHWADQLRGDAQPRIGLVWAGGTLFGNDRLRSIDLQVFSKIATPGNRRFFSLQRDLRPNNETLLKSMPNVMHLGQHLSDFSETAAIISNLDLVISVDTSVAHLAGALGKPVWILIPFSPDFRWLLDRDDSPWYPTARLFRQSSIGVWQNAIQDVLNALDVQFGRE